MLHQNEVPSDQMLCIGADGYRRHAGRGDERRLFGPVRGAQRSGRRQESHDGDGHIQVGPQEDVLRIGLESGAASPRYAQRNVQLS